MVKINHNFLNISLLIVCTLISLFLFQNLLNIDEKYQLFLSETLIENKVKSIIQNKEKWEWLSYILVLTLLLIKIFTISLIIQIGTFLFGIDLKFKKIINFVVKAEFVFVIVAFIKLIWLYLKSDYSYLDAIYFYPLSILNIVGHEDLSSWFIYPLQTFNVFEIIYWFVLAYFLAKQINKPTDVGFKIIASSYGSSLLLWMVVIMFFTLNAN